MAHAKGPSPTIKAGPGSFPAGVTLDDAGKLQGVGPGRSRRPGAGRPMYSGHGSSRAARSSQFVGVQTYSRLRDQRQGRPDAVQTTGVPR